jgi:hypothetical protein
MTCIIFINIYSVKNKIKHVDKKIVKNKQTIFLISPSSGRRIKFNSNKPIFLISFIYLYTVMCEFFLSADFCTSCSLTNINVFLNQKALILVIIQSVLNSQSKKYQVHNLTLLLLKNLLYNLNTYFLTLCVFSLRYNETILVFSKCSAG